MKPPPAAATGIGSLPGTDAKDAIAATFGELPDLPYLPELPARGPGADLIGRTAGLLVDLPVELYAGRWQVASRPGADLRRTYDLLERDLDTLTEQGDGFTGTLKIQSAGPWTLAASLELPLGGAILQDHGAVADLAASLAEGLKAHVADVRRRIPGADVVLQLDEPSLPAALAGRVPTQSGLHTYRSIPEATARDTLAAIAHQAGAPVAVHCCARDVPITLLREAGAEAVSVDLTLLGSLDPLGEAIDAGVTLFAGVTSTSSKDIAERITRALARARLPPRSAPRARRRHPACGLAHHTPAQARAILKACREAATRLQDAAA